MTADESFFLHGVDYTRTRDTPRGSLCATCAFRLRPPTVRPADVSVVDLENMSAEYDGFVCHHADADGVHPECAGWHARFGRTAK